MDRTAAQRAGEEQDQALDLPPAAEVDDIAELAASAGARRRLAGGVNAEARDQLGRVGRGRAVGEVDMGVQGFLVGS